MVRFVSNELFTKFNLDDRLSNARLGAIAGVGEMPEGQFLASSDDQIIDYLTALWTLAPIALQESEAAMEQKETNVDISGDPYRNRWGDNLPHFTSGTAATIRIPYTGTPWLWDASPNPNPHERLTGTVYSNPGSMYLEFTIELPHHLPKEKFKEFYDHHMRKLRKVIEFSTIQVNRHNNSLESIIRSAVTQRRDRLSKHAGIAAILNIRLQQRPGAPPIQRIPLEIRKPPPLPVPPKDGLRPEPGIDPSTFEKIIGILRHEGRSFETTPATFAKHDEEELRDIIVAHLNGHFEGDASGETFRRKGKTDIVIEDKNRSAFVAECKVWNGASEFTKAVDQLLSYLTWRDSKAALVVFNKTVAGFTELPPRLHQSLVAHPFFISEIPLTQPGESRVVMRSVEDAGRRVTVHAFIFNLYLA